jgi:uncharacterized phiE125 gp8 family phage protein
VILLLFLRSAIGWWRGRGLIHFERHQKIAVEPALARYFIAAGAAVFYPPDERKGFCMHTWVTHGIERTIAPAIEPITLAEAKQFLRVDNSADDAPITLMITGAREAAERYLGLSFITQSWKLTLAEYLPETVPLRFGPVQSITSVTILLEAGGTQVLSASGYRLSIDKRAIEILTPITGYRFEIVYQSGYGATAASIPGLIRQGILQHLAAMYDLRSPAAALPALALQSYHPYREMSL